MNLSDYLAKQPHGSGSRLARAIKAHAPDVSMWAAGKKPVPIERCVQIEHTTDGLVRRWDLRPEDWWKIWPELVGTEGAPAVSQKAVA